MIVGIKYVSPDLSRKIKSSVSAEESCFQPLQRGGPTCSALPSVKQMEWISKTV